MSYVARHIAERCLQCGACFELVACPGTQEDICIGCGACVVACPHQALELVEEARKAKITINVDGRKAEVSERISVKEALSELGYNVTCLPTESGIFAPCHVGGCMSCAVEIDGFMRPSCVSAVKEGMTIKTEPSETYVPRRIVMNFLEHPVGGVGTPWNLRKGTSIIEIVCFTAGCNFRCPQCQNWTITYRGKGEFLTPEETARLMWIKRRHAGVDRMTISGGESTLNRPWLVQYIRELKKLNPDTNARFHVDTNGSLLVKDYIDELVDAGMTDIGIDLKSLRTDTFMRITGLDDEKVAQCYKEIAWEAVKYLTQYYKDKVFLGIGIPYNKGFISLSEVRNMGKEIYHIDPSVQVCVNDYRPEFRSRITKPTYQDMRLVYNLLEATGLKTVVCQTPEGYIYP